MRDRLAFMTLAVLREPIGSPVAQGFADPRPFDAAGAPTRQDTQALAALKRS